MLTDNPAAPLLLVIEDDRRHARLIREAFLEAEDEYRLECVGSFLEARTIMQRCTPDLILSNHLLPDGSGNDLISEVKGNCPVILMTSQGNEQLAVSTMKAGAQDYLTKSPDTVSSLPATVKLALLEWRLLRDRQKIYAAVSRGKREWEQTFDAVPDLIVIIDTDHTISRVNRAMAARCGLHPADLPGRKCYQIFHGTDTPPDSCPLVRLLAEGREQTEEIEEGKLAGFFNITVSPLYDEAGKLTACVHVARDITERKRAEEDRLVLEQQLQQAQKLESLGVLAGGIAHDFNNILTIILGHCCLAKDDADTGAVSNELHLNQIEAAANRAADLCRQMLNYAGKSPLVQTRIDLPVLVDEIVKMLTSALKKNVSFERNFAAGLPEITGDQAKIQQIVMNLLVNAVEAIGENSGIVKVALSRGVVQSSPAELDFLGNPIAAGSYACLEVSDTGCGMDEETMKRIFEPFFTTKFTGRGLGMSAMIGIIKSHHGALQLSSEPGLGSTFRLYFPLSADAPAAEQPPVPGAGGAVSRQPSLKGTVLLVDDEAELLKVGGKMLSALGFTVIQAANGREALETFSKHGSAIDLVFLDLTMPEMDGIEAYAKLRRVAPTLPIVICSGYGDDNEIASCIEADPYAEFLPKPYLPDRVRRVVTGLLKGDGAGARG